MTYTRRLLSLLMVLPWLALAAGSASAQTPTPDSSQVSPHEQMHQMMDAMHGPGASERMHQAMGPEGEQLMEQCAAMMPMMGMMGPGGMGGMGGMMNMMGMMGSGGMGGMMGMGWIMMLLGLLLVVLVIGAGIALVTVLVRRGQPAGAGSRQGEPAVLATLQERYARGEISRDEYEQVRADLLRDSGRP